MKAIDINCDMGESFGRYSLGQDEEMMDLVSTINIACGFHAGDPLVIEATVANAIRNGVAIGAHPSYPDLQGFGRRAMDLTPEEVEAMVLYQIGAVYGFVKAAGGNLSHVKPHGALYNQAASSPALARAICRAVTRFSQELILVGLAGSRLIAIGLEEGLRVAAEGFPERGYNPDGTLISRRLPGAMINDPTEAAKNALKLANEGITGPDGQVWRIDTLCIHGDSARGLENARAVRENLEQNGWAVQALSWI
jgi:5-oxoprolinase (ATP-hydrolysing) subunit A